MKAYHIRRFTLIACCAVAGLSFGCKTSNQATESTKAVDSMQNVSTKVDQAKASVARVSTALDKLSAGGDMKAAFAEYSTAVKELKSTGDEAAKRGEDMRQRRQAYLDRWQTEISEMQNVEIQQSLMARRQRVVDEYDKVKSLATDVRNAYGPFLQDNLDIQKALSIDLTPAGVAELQPVIKTAKAEGVVLNDKLDAFKVAVDSLIGKISPAVTPTK